MAASKLSPDIIHEILISITDSMTLSVAIRVCKSFYQVFHAHPKSILRQVIMNITGPAMPQAARLAQYQQRVYDPDGDTVDPPLDEDHFHDLDWRPAMGVLYMESNQWVVRVIRDLYSQRHKDRTSPTSRLDTVETLRFDRAFYRYWLCLKLLQHHAFGGITEDEDDEDDDANDEDRLKKSVHEGLMAFLKVLPTDELLELLHVGMFCKERTDWLAQGLFSSGLAWVIDAESTLDPFALVDSWESGYKDLTRFRLLHWAPIRLAAEELLLSSRKVKQEELDKRQSSAVIRSIVGADDTCFRCNMVTGVRLIGEPNMSLLFGMLPARDKVALLPGLLSRNEVESNMLSGHLLVGHDEVERIPEKVIFHELVDLALSEDELGDQEQHQWSKDGWYCLDCIKELYKQHFMVWWREAKAKSRSLLQEDCWYGYNCRTMTHRSSHAMKLNHLCTPTRGDDAPKPPP